MFTLFKIIFKILKWAFVSLIVVLILASIIPYFFNLKNADAAEKPYANSYFFNYENTSYHYQLAVPKLIKHKILLIHGFSASTFSFRNNIESLLQQNCLVLAIDMPAFGYSDKTENANYSDVSKINAINKLLEKINSENKNSDAWIVLGHSMGANTSAQLASVFPGQVKALIWIDGAAIPIKNSQFQKLALYPPLLKWADVVLEKKYLNFNSFKELLSSAYSQEADSVAVNGYLEPFKKQGSGSAIFRMFANSGNVIVNDSVLALKPKLVIWGKNDQWIPFSKIQQDLKGNIVLIEDAGHCPMETHASLVNDYIIQFLKTMK